MKHTISEFVGQTAGTIDELSSKSQLNVIMPPLENSSSKPAMVENALSPPHLGKEGVGGTNSSSKEDGKPKLFKCTQCNATQDSYEKHKLHMKSGKCGIVMSRYYRKDGKKKRRKGQTKFFTRPRQRIDKSNDYEISCDYCSYTTTSSNKGSLIRHVKVLHEKGRSEKMRVDDGRLKQNRQCCPFCEYNTSKKTNMVCHITQAHLEPLENDHGEVKETRDSNKPAILGEKNGDETKTNGDVLEQVPNSSSNQFNNLLKRCPQCPFVGSEREKLEDHIEIVHTKMRNIPYAIVFACLECDYGALEEKTLKQHMISVHNQISNEMNTPSGEAMGVFQSQTGRVLVEKEDKQSKFPVEDLNISTEQTLKCKFCPFESVSKSKMTVHNKLYCDKQKSRGSNERRVGTGRLGVKKETNSSLTNIDLNLSDPQINNTKSLIGARGNDTVNNQGNARLNRKEPKGMFYCDKCPYETLNKTSIMEHSKKVHGSKSAILNYDPKTEKTPGASKLPPKKITEEEVPLKTMYKRIKLYRFDDPSRRFKCPICEHRSSQKDNMQTHIRRVHYQIRDHPCPHCNHASKGKNSLMHHIKTVHEHEKNFGCAYPGCSYKAYDKCNMKVHVKRIHEQTKDIECPVDGCDYKSFTRGGISVHIKGFHDKIRDKICQYENCDFKTTLSTDLNRHIKAVHLKIKLYCPHCEYITHRDVNLTAHIRSIHKTKSLDQACEICGFATDKEFKLKLHMKRVHENSKAFVCDVCLRYSSDDFSKLKRHISLRHKGFDKRKRKMNRRRNIVTMSSETDSDDGVFMN